MVYCEHIALLSPMHTNTAHYLHIGYMNKYRLSDKHSHEQ